MNVLRKTGNAVVTTIETADIWGPLSGSIVAVAGIGVLAVGALHPAEIDGDGHGKDSAKYNRALPVAERVEHDFANWSVEAGDDCLENTGYDPFDYTKYGDAQKAHDVGTVSFKGGVIVIEPGKPDESGKPLELLPNDGSKPLQGATRESQVLLNELHCDTTY